MPETRYEMHDGELVHVSPADPPHGKLHLQLCALIEAHTGYDFEAACDLLTRTSRGNDVAPDVSVYPAAPDPDTGGRQLEQLAFEIVSTESLAHASGKAAKLTGRGVRRVFAVDIERSRVLEWSAALSSWGVLEDAGQIEDAALDVALPIEAMVHAAKADDAMAQALIARHNPVIEAAKATERAEGRAEGIAEGRAEGIAEGRAEGIAEGRAEGIHEGFARGRSAGLCEAVLAALASRGIAVGPGDRARILEGRDPAQLSRWLARAVACTEVGQVFVDE